jgi:hypothetical protein
MRIYPVIYPDPYTVIEAATMIIMSAFEILSSSGKKNDVL